MNETRAMLCGLQFFFEESWNAYFHSGWTGREENNNGGRGDKGVVLYSGGYFEEKKTQGRIVSTYKENPVGVWQIWREKEEGRGYQKAWAFYQGIQRQGKFSNGLV